MWVVTELLGAELLAFIIRKARLRRDLTIGQKTTLAVKLRSLPPEETALLLPSILNYKEPTAAAPATPSPKLTQKEVAALTGVSERNVATMEKVQREAPAVFEVVDDGLMSVHAGEQIAELEPEERVAVLGDYKAGNKKGGRAAIKAQRAKSPASRSAKPEQPTLPRNYADLISLTQGMTRLDDTLAGLVKQLSEQPLAASHARQLCDALKAILTIDFDTLSATVQQTITLLESRVQTDELTADPAVSNLEGGSTTA